jgi:hypothetical protein
MICLAMGHDSCKRESVMIPTTRSALWLTCAALVLGGCGESQPRAEQKMPSFSSDTAAVTAEPAIPDTTTPAPADVVRRYYAGIQARDYDAAYSLWGQLGRASGKTRAAFTAGFSDTREVRATIGDSVRVEGAAGSQYATVPVKVDAVLRNGRRQHFEGAYTLRRSMVDGATAEQRRWRIYSADLR